MKLAHNLNKLKPNKKNLLYWLGVAGVVGAVGLSWWLKTNTPPLTPTPENTITQSNFDGTSSKFAHITYTGKEVFVPKKFTLFQAQKETASKQIAQIKTEFKLTKNEEVENLWEGPRYFLMFDPATNLYSLRRKTAAQTTGKINLGQTLAAAQNIVAMFDFKDLSPNVDKIDYLVGRGELTPTAKNTNAKYVNIPFTYKLENLPVYLGKDNFPSATIRLDHNLKLYLLEFKPELFQFNPVIQKSTLSLKEAINNIKNGVGSIIFIKNKVDIDIDLNQITQATFTSARLEYRVDENGTTLPYYHFFGRAINNQGKQFKLEVITPATKK